MRQAPTSLSYENVFRVAIVQFMARYNFCVGGVKRSCIPLSRPNGQIIPFDTYKSREGSGLTLIRGPLTNDCLPAANPYIAPQYGPPICGLLTHWNHT